MLQLKEIKQILKEQDFILDDLVSQNINIEKYITELCQFENSTLKINFANSITSKKISGRNDGYISIKLTYTFGKSNITYNYMLTKKENLILN